MSISNHLSKFPKNFILNFSIALALVFMGSAAHPYYVGVTEVSIETAKKDIRVSCKLNMNDVQLTLSQTAGKAIDLSTITPANQLSLSALIQAGLSVQVGSKRINLAFLGYLIEDDAIWCFLEAKNIKYYPRISVCNNLLYNQFEAQTHFVHCILNGGRKSTKITNPEKCATFVY
ncbi:MAG: hypothetical protein O2814_07245 [Bacteroidetes bacterium]|nr:hypothetical protein [Bacteroidota bacterium]MDA1224351.1 hypothetical protein [Bacteroidota bacterium]